MVNEAYGALLAALNAQDVTCWNVFETMYTKLSWNEVYVARQAPPNFSGTFNGVTNTGTEPYEMYVHENRLETPTGRFNTMSHESEHAHRGRRPASMQESTWEGDIQSVADGCDQYSYF